VNFRSGPVLLSVALLFLGCATDSSSPVGTNPDLGLTARQITARYGKPGNIRSTADGEVWVYNLDKGEKIVPWTKGYKPRLRVVEFNREGRVKNSTADK
jgi:hypothetical protein